MGGMEGQIIRVSAGRGNFSRALRGFPSSPIIVDGLCLTEFATRLYPGQELGDILSSVEDRTPKGKEAHFDVYQGVVASEHPRIGVYNLEGQAQVSVAALPEDLSRGYDKCFPEPTDEAFVARRVFASRALRGNVVLRGVLGKGSGFVIPQQEGQHIAHKITPENPDEPGRYVKVVLPGNEEFLKESGYKPVGDIARTVYSGSLGDGASEGKSKVPIGALLEGEPLYPGRGHRGRKEIYSRRKID
ncbi:hypothetical protein H6792_01965 [Candidatus Nomurabacteria bacterium]|nr:hypothetical protein [Candidatus Nomurabacteria bacterium]